MSSAAGKMNMTNTTTKAQVMKVITAAAKNGTKAEWKSFRKVDATYESKGRYSLSESVTGWKDKGTLYQ